jgi:acyl transferase domain-containing protein
VLDDAQSYLASRDIQRASLRTKIQPMPNVNEGMANGNGKPADLKSLTNELFFVFSGPDQQALERNLKVIAQHLQTKTFSDLESESEYLRNLAYTLSERRSMFRLKAAIVAVSVDQLASRIRERCIVRIDKHVAVPTKSNLANGNEGKITRHLLTDLPSYAWDHSRTYWAESRASKEFRHRKHPQRSLIGAPQPSYGEGEHIWRGYLRLLDEPWVKDHQVLGAIVYPAAGYIAMAIEAARDIADKGRAISRYTLRDVQFHSAAVIKEDVPLELIIQLRPHRTATRATSASWLEFAISSCHNERNMRENCFGLLSIEYEAADDSPLALEQSQEEDRILKQYERAHGECGINQNPKALYEELASVGLNYGQAFQQISKVTKSEGCSSCQVELYTPDRIPDGDLRPVIHPATLDCMIQTIFPALVGHRARMQAAMVPTLLEHMSISAQTPTSTGTCFRGFSTAKYGGAREMVADFAMLDHETSKPAVITTGLRCTAISELPKSTVEASEVGGRSICSRIVWTPAMDILSPAEQLQVIQSATSLHKLRNVRLDFYFYFFALPKSAVMGSLTIS